MPDPDASPRPSVSGKAVVGAMFLFGIGSTLALYLYWKAHMTPFLPLQEALASEFSDSSPRVDGGQTRMQLNTPHILRVVMRVRYDPKADDDHTRAQLDRQISRIAEIAAEHLDLTEFDRLEVHFYMPDPESSLRQARFVSQLNAAAAD